jgi:thioredoxin reductase (NADPH)
MIPAAALFVMIGARPQTDWLPPAILRDPYGYILTGEDLIQHGRPIPDWPLQRSPLMMETSLPGVFAVGDVRHNSLKRVAAAVGDGSIAVQFVHQYFMLLSAAV